MFPACCCPSPETVDGRVRISAAPPTVDATKMSLDHPKSFPKSPVPAHAPGGGAAAVGTALGGPGGVAVVAHASVPELNRPRGWASWRWNPATAGLDLGGETFQAWEGARLSYFMFGTAAGVDPALQQPPPPPAAAGPGSILYHFKRRQEQKEGHAGD